jgi:hypothetical protein
MLTDDVRTEFLRQPRSDGPALVVTLVANYNGAYIEFGLERLDGPVRGRRFGVRLRELPALRAALAAAEAAGRAEQRALRERRRSVARDNDNESPCERPRSGDYESPCGDADVGDETGPRARRAG